MNPSMLIGAGAMALTLALSVLRDAALTAGVPHRDVFVSLVSLTALVTAPHAEAAQYGSRDPLTVAALWRSVLAVLLGACAVAALDAWGGPAPLRFVVALGVGLAAAFLVNLACAGLARVHGPHVVRVIGPVFPIANFGVMLLTRSAPVLAVVSYAAVLVAVSVAYSASGPKLRARPRGDGAPGASPWESLAGVVRQHAPNYLAFGLAHGFVLLNTNTVLRDVSVAAQRLPVYAFSATSFVMPYLSRLHGGKTRAIRALAAAGLAAAAASAAISVVIHGAAQPGASAAKVGLLVLQMLATALACAAAAAHVWRRVSEPA